MKTKLYNQGGGVYRAGVELNPHEQHELALKNIRSLNMHEYDFLYGSLDEYIVEYDELIDYQDYAIREELLKTIPKEDDENV